MAIETELKLRIAPEDMARLKRHPFLRSLSGERATSRKLYSVYFDTPDLKLHHGAMALRLRRVGKQWLQTLKGGGGVRAGLHQRNEWETPVAAEQLDFAALEAAGASPLPPNLRKKLQPLFVTDFTRSIRMLQFEGALIELCMDSGEIRAGKSMHTISELELELKSGEPLQLFRLALALLDIVPVEVETTSKAEYGYRLHLPVRAMVGQAQLPKLDGHDTVESALQQMIWSCLFHLQANVAGAVKKADDEYLHQIRVALRRLRVALSMSAKHRGDAELESLRKLVAELGTALGRSREWDVFVTQVLPAVQKYQHVHTGFDAVAQQSEKFRQHCHRHVHAALQSGDFQRLLLRFGAWMNGEYWRGPANRDDLSGFAAKILRKRSRRVHQCGMYIQKADARQLHVLRIACKNLRYSADLFASLYGADKTKSYLNALVRLQGTLGVLNDNAVALNLLDELDRGAQQEAIALIRTRIAHHNSKLLTELREAWGKFSELSAF
ncbi:MAG: CYTH and CHAD domain-containing protein [Gallionellaceae bacterium]|nr:MAG: CYTH and CHAD domain-containing protein [Gallionellaceae bacterium]